MTRMFSYSDLINNKELLKTANELRSAYASDILDQLGIQGVGGPHFWLPENIRYLAGAENDPQRKVFGFAHTGKFRVLGEDVPLKKGVNAYATELKLISSSKPGDIIVVDTPAQKKYESHSDNVKKQGGVWGGLLTIMSMSQGAVGAIINGPIRDTDQINSYFRKGELDDFSKAALNAEYATLRNKSLSEEQFRKIKKLFLKREKFPVFGTGMLPTDSSNRVECYDIKEPLYIGGVKINEGDFIVGDNDGQVVIPAKHIESVLQKVSDIDIKDRGVWAAGVLRFAGLNDEPIQSIVERHGGHL